MTTAYITVGLGFGDEGKGATVHHLVKKTQAKWVVRYSGGCQCAHTVKLADGRTHKFAQWGAGTFAGANTYLGPHVVVDPVAMTKEGRRLQELDATYQTSSGHWTPGIYVHPRALVTNIYAIYLNRLKEMLRGNARHGSCGYGIGETRSYALRYGSDAIRAEDTNNYGLLCDKLSLMRERFLAEVADLAEKHIALDDVIPQMKMSPDTILPCDVAKSLHRSMMIESYFEPHGCPVVFEGAQGTLLDEWHGFHPHTTWSTVTDEHAYELIPSNYDVRTIGVTRAFTTRHGAGPLPTEFSSDALVDPNNPRNDWQGGFRWGHLDMTLLDYAASCQVRLDSLSLTWLDALVDGECKIAVRDEPLRRQLYPNLDRQSKILQRLEPPKIIEVSRSELFDRIEEATGAVVTITGAGPTEGDYRS